MDEAFVYLWYDAGWEQTGGPRYYIGKHKGTLDSGYVCSSKYMKPEWEERGCKQVGCRHLFRDKGHHGDFHRRVLAYGTEQEMVDFEIKLLETRKNYFRSRYYNRVVVWMPCNSGKNNFNYKHGLSGTPEYMKLIREKHREKIALQQKQKYKRNREKILLQQKQYKKQNKGKIALHNKQYREQNREKTALYSKRYRERKKQEKLEILEGII